ncbi:hypothetical protein BH10ACT3_BH10ACT3_15110 [soil metagenome]
MAPAAVAEWLRSAVVSASVGEDQTAPVTRRRQPSTVLVAALGFVLFTLVLLVIGRFALDSQVAPARQEFEPGSGWFGQWVRWDANWYYRIAHDGYDWMSGPQRAVAFWPVYPMSIRALTGLTHDEYDAGLIITWLSGFTTVVLLAYWCKDKLTRAASLAAVLTLLLLPYSWYLGWSVYGDAMFAACAIAAFVLLEKDRPVLAGIVGAVAAAGRPMGLAVVAGLVILTLERRDAFQPMLARSGSDSGAGEEPRWRRALVWLKFPRSLTLKHLRLKDWGVWLSLVGPLSYMAFLWHADGTPLAFADAESAPGWDHKPGPRTWLKLNVLNGIREVGITRETAGMVLHVIRAVGAVLLIPKVIRRFGWGYGAYCVILIGIPIISSKDFYGLGRYLLSAFPVMAIAGEWMAGSRIWIRASIWTVSGILAVVLSYSYARGLYVA